MTKEPSALLLIHDRDQPRRDILTALRARYVVEICPLEAFGPELARQFPLLVIDTELQRASQAKALRSALSRLANRAVHRLFIVDEHSHLLQVRASAFGAEAVITRPLSVKRLFSAIDSILGGAEFIGLDAATLGYQAGVDAVEQILQFASFGIGLTQDELYDHGDRIIASMSEIGLANWMETVRKHHSRTFRHSLLVTGVSVGFGQFLGVGHADQRRLAIGGLMHDIGKAKIPIDLLEKPEQLTAEETKIMRQHADFGRDILLQSGGFSPEMIDVVAHHHEMLDGSGYPDGLMGDRIPDLVRAVTVADIFSALIEERAYKPRILAAEACEIMTGMGGKLDQDMVREFSHIALGTPLARSA